MTKSGSDLDEVYGANTVEDIRNIYEGWAAAYDLDNLQKGYRLPAMAAGYVTRYIDRGAGPILDAGCGTGLVGEALNILGYSDLEGFDLSPQMAAAAATRKVYRKLGVQELGKEIPEDNNRFEAVTCIGSFGPGHAPPASLDELVRIVRPEGHIIFNIRDDTYIEQGFKARMDALSAAGKWQLVEASPAFRAFLVGEPDITVMIFVYRVQ